MTSEEKQEWFDKINRVLESVRPHLAADGGDVEIADVSENLEVAIRWKGNCLNCDMSAMTLKAGIEQAIKHQYPQIVGVKAVKD